MSNFQQQQLGSNGTMNGNHQVNNNILSSEPPIMSNDSTFESTFQNNIQKDLFAQTTDQIHTSSSGNSQQYSQMMKEITDLKEKNRVMTQKFQSCKKERDQLKKENTELQEQVASLQNQMRSMVQCPNNSS